jgi:hypothetical protein
MELLDSDEDLDVYETAAPILFRPSQVKFPSPRLLVIVLYSIIRNYCLYIFWSSNIIFLFCLFYLLSPHYLPALLQHVCEEDIEAY